MQNIKEFMVWAKKDILSMLPGDLTKNMTIEENTVIKMNDQFCYGLTLKRGEEEAAPTIYMNEYFDRYINGEPFKQLMAEACQEYLDALVNKPDIVTQDLTFENIKDNLTIRVMEGKRNIQFLSNIPFMSVGNGFVAVCDIKVVEEDAGYWRTTINQNLMEENHYDKNEMFKAALENSQEKNPVIMTSIMDQLFGEGDKNLMDMDGIIPEESKDNMYVISTHEGLLGATAFFYPGIREKISEKLGEGYYALPSSINEILVVPESCAPPIKDIIDMVYEANHSVVDPKEVLSDNIFFFDRDTKTLETIKSDVVRGIDSPDYALRS